MHPSRFLNGRLARSIPVVVIRSEAEEQNLRASQGDRSYRKPVGQVPRTFEVKPRVEGQSGGRSAGFSHRPAAQ